MALKGSIPVVYNGQTHTFYPKTIAEQVKIDAETTLLDKLVELDSTIENAQSVNDPDLAKKNIIYKISGSEKMPTMGDYVLRPSAFDDGRVHQVAICVETRDKIERWFSDDSWSKWTAESSGALKLSTSYLPLEVTSDNQKEFANPIVGYDPEKHEVIGIIKNTAFLPKTYFTVSPETITLNEEVNPSFASGKLELAVVQLVKNDTEIEYDFDGRNIASQSIDITKLDQKITDTLKHADTLKNIEVSPVDVTIKGRTLINLLGRIGNALYRNWNSVLGDMEYDEEKFVLTKAGGDRIVAMNTKAEYVNIAKDKYYIAVADVKAEETDELHAGLTSGLLVEKRKKIEAKNKDTFTYCAWFETRESDAYIELSAKNKMIASDIRLYEINKTVYDKIDTDPEYTGEALVKRYQYVDDIKSVVNPYAECNMNLFHSPLFEEGYIDENGKFVPSQTGVIYSQIMDFKPGTYTLNIEGLDTSVYSISLEEQISTKTYTFETDVKWAVSILRNDKSIDRHHVKSMVDKINKGEWKITIVKGEKSIPYDQCVNSRIVFETELHENETISKNEFGEYIKSSEWAETYIEPHIFKHMRNGEGYKLFTGVLDVPHDWEVAYRYNYLVDFLGRVVKHSMDFTPTGYHYYIESNNAIHLSLPNTLTGWGDAYTPTADEIKAFLSGWRMFEANSSNEFVSDLYNGSGTKGWIRLWCGAGEQHESDFSTPVMNFTGVSNVPKEHNQFGYVGYKIIYRKRVSNIETVKTHGTLIARKGFDITIGSGLVLKEISDIHDNGKWCTGGQIAPKYPIEQIVDVLVDDIRPVFTHGRRIHNGTDANTQHHTLLRGKGFPTFYPNLDIDKKYVFIDYKVADRSNINIFEMEATKGTETREILHKTIDELSRANRDLSDQCKMINEKLNNLKRPSNPNLLINGDFQVWQRGDSFDIQDNKKRVYTADRWAISKSEGNEVSVRRSADNNLILDVKQFTSGYINLEYCFDKSLFDKIAGKKVTITVKLKYPQRISNVGLRTFPEKSATRATTEVSDTYVYTTYVPEPKTNFTNAIVYIQKHTPGVIEIEYIKLEIGDESTPLVSRHYFEELTECRYYYEDTVQATTYLLAQDSHILYFPYSTSKRIIPTVTFKDSQQIDKINVDGTSISVDRKVPEMDCVTFTINGQAGGAESSGRLSTARCRLIVDAEIY